VPGAVGLIGFGVSAPGALTFGVIDLSERPNFAFSMPRSGIITSVSAYFSTAAALSLTGTSIAITAQVYSSAIPNNTFAPVPGAFVSLPALSGTVAAGRALSGIASGIAIPVTAQTRLLMVFSASAWGVSPINMALGHASAGISVN
jgi:BclB C-terminal domain-containing protein